MKETAKQLIEESIRENKITNIDVDRDSEAQSLMFEIMLIDNGDEWDNVQNGCTLEMWGTVDGQDFRVHARNIKGE